MTSSANPQFHESTSKAHLQQKNKYFQRWGWEFFFKELAKKQPFWNYLVFLRRLSWLQTNENTSTAHLQMHESTSKVPIKLIMSTFKGLNENFGYKRLANNSYFRNNIVSHQPLRWFQMLIINTMCVLPKHVFNWKKFL